MATNESHQHHSAPVRGGSRSSTMVFIIGALVVAVLIIGYFVMTPASNDGVDMTAQPPAATEPMPTTATTPQVAPATDSAATPAPAPDASASGSTSVGTTGGAPAPAPATSN